MDEGGSNFHGHIEHADSPNFHDNIDEFNNFIDKHADGRARRRLKQLVPDQRRGWRSAQLPLVCADVCLLV